MPFEDPKTTILKLLNDHFVVTKDDNSAASFKVSFEFPEEELASRFASTDVILTIGRESEVARRLGLNPVFKYVGTYRIGVWAKEKEGINGEGICTRSIQKIKSIIKAHESAPGGNLRFIRKVNTRDDDRVGSPTLFHRLIIAETWHYGQEES
jgi:hypothetical protein